MPRTRTIANSAILAATIDFVTHNGIEKLTFVSLGKQIGLSPSTLVQRFGTKHKLLVAAMEYGFQDIESTLQTAREDHTSPLETILTALVTMAQVVGTKEEFANGQAFFQLALTNKKMYARLRASTDLIRKEIKQLLDAAVVTGELRACDTEALALTLQTTYEGAITTWIIYQQDSIETWVQHRLNAVIIPYYISHRKERRTINMSKIPHT